MTQHSPSTAPRLPMLEFIALMAMIAAIVAFSIDAMLPALPQIAAELTPAAPELAQLLISSFVLGMGIGTFFAGPLSDAFGRRRIIIGGTVLYAAGALIAGYGGSLEAVLIGRLIQGLGAAGPRIASIALVRDIHAGRQMAKIMSYVMMAFTLVPAMAPLVGSFIIADFGWRGIFPAFVIFALSVIIWFAVRQPETLPPEARKSLRLSVLLKGAAEVMRMRVAQVSILVQALILGVLFAMISQIHTLFDEVYDMGASFPYWFAALALISGAGSFANAQLVVRLGMRRLVKFALGGLALASAVVVVPTVLGLVPQAAAFPLFLIWICLVFTSIGFILGNMNAIAMEPLGHLAGMAASMISAFATVIAVVVAAPLGLAYDGTILPLCIGTAVLSAVSLLFLRGLPAAPHR